jgi:hypothetical protein
MKVKGIISVLLAYPAAAAVGADATASNAPTAVLAAQKLFDIAAQRGFEGCLDP